MSPGSPTAEPIWLSHELSPETPAYGGGDSLRVTALTEIAGGDTANTVQLTLPNHVGTHVDAPAHFFEDGATLSDFPPSAWLFESPVVIDVDVPSGSLVEPKHVSALPVDADLLLVRTGHGAARGSSHYWEGGPGLSAALGRWLRVERPNVRAVGMDLISVTTRLDRPAGREAHRAFLTSDEPGRPILLVEDMDLAGCPSELAAVWMAPLLLSRGDGAPITVMGFPKHPRG